MTHAITVLKAEAVAEILGCEVTTVEERARAGDLPGLKFGHGGWVFPLDALTTRLNELALSESANRRVPAKPSGRLMSVTTGGKAASKHQPPQLPTLP